MHRCAIEHDGWWLAQFQSLGGANPNWLRETSFLDSGEVPTPQTHAPWHATQTFPLNPLYPAPTLSLGGELFTRMQKIERLRPKDAAVYICMVASALGFLSERHIAHRDLKLENLLIDEVGYLKLVDFGFTTRPDDAGVMRTQVGTPMYLSPEQLNSKFTKGYTKIVDWWAFACITYELMVGLTPFCRDNKESAHAIYLRVLRGKVSFPSHFDKRGKRVRLIKRILHDRWCHCGDSFGSAAESDQCTQPCEGDDTETCGGVNVFDEYYALAKPAETDDFIMQRA